MITLGIIESNYYLRTSYTEFLGSFSKNRIQFAVPDINEFTLKLRNKQFCPPEILLIGMEDADGAEVQAALRYLKAAVPATKIILITNCTSSQMIAAFLRSGAEGHLVQTRQIKELIDAIEAVRNKGGYLCGQSAMLLRQYFASPKEPLDKILTPREIEIVTHIKTGSSVKQIAGMLHVSLATVNFHLHNVYKKLKVSSRSALMATLAA